MADARPAHELDAVTRVTGRIALRQLAIAIDALSGRDLAFVVNAMTVAAHEADEIVAAAKEESAKENAK
jgi:hypothetical protein